MRMLSGGAVRMLALSTLPARADGMATLTIGNLDDDLTLRLRVAAALNQCSMEEEVRVILRHALAPDSVEGGLGTRIHERFSGFHVDDLELATRDELPRLPDFSE